MADYNLTQEGNVVQVLLDAVAAGYIYMGVADLTTTPDTTNPNVCYLLKAVGTYTNFGNIQHASGIGIALWNGTAWSYQNVPSAAVVQTDAAPMEGSTNPVQSGGMYNLLNSPNYVVGGYYKSTGAVETNVDWCVQTDYIPVSKGDSFKWNAGAIFSSACIIVYNSSYERVNYFGTSAAPRTVTIGNDDAAYIRISFSASAISTAYAEVNGVRVWTPNIGLDGAEDRLAKSSKTIQSDAVYNAVQNIREDIFGKNYSSGRWLSNGTVLSMSGWSFSRDKIPVKYNDIVEFNAGTTNASSCLVFFANDGTFVNSYAANAVPRVGLVSWSNAAYCCMCFANEYIDNVYVKVNGKVVWTPTKNTFGIGTYILDGEIIGGSNAAIDKRVDSLVPNSRYRLYVTPQFFDVTDVTTTTGDIVGIYNVVSGVSSRIIGVTNPNASQRKPYYEFIVPTTSDYIILTFRAANFASVKYSLYKEEDLESPSLALAYADIFKNITGETESFLFYTDMHLFLGYSSQNVTSKGRLLLEEMATLQNSCNVDSVLDGGDWLTSHKQTIAIEYLSMYSGWTRNLFRNYYPAFGNHDNNYQGELDDTESTTANDGAITNQQVQNLMFNRFGGLFYKFKSASTLWFVLDTGSDWDNTMTSYRWGQIDWLANELLATDSNHIAVLMHIVKNNGVVQTFADNVTKLLSAFNSKTSITFNSQTYDFSSTTGVIHFVLGGHEHSQSNFTLNDIPVFLGNAATNSEFYLLVADYSAQKLRGVTALGNTIDVSIL